MRRVARKRKVKMSFVPAIISIALIVVIVLIITRFNDIMQQRERIVSESRQLSLQEESLKARLENLQFMAGGANDAAKVENIARGQLDMVYPGEIIFRVSGE
ncbi:Cell division protein FtsB [Ruminococcaceae bacterium YRB3002]|nr:Cell division protein FtsB [Ruminococcaceae bacterium YRB3002]